MTGLFYSKKHSGLFLTFHMSYIQPSTPHYRELAAIRLFFSISCLKICKENHSSQKRESPLTFTNIEAKLHFNADDSRQIVFIPGDSRRTLKPALVVPSAVGGQNVPIPSVSSSSNSCLVVNLQNVS